MNPKSGNLLNETRNPVTPGGGGGVAGHTCRYEPDDVWTGRGKGWSDQSAATEWTEQIPFTLKVHMHEIFIVCF